MNDNIRTIVERHHPTGESRWSRVVAMARRVDALPVAPARLGDRALDRFLEQRKTRAAADPVWAEIEARRHSDGRAGVVMLSEELDLGWREHATQNRIAEELTPDPVWLGIARRVRRMELAPVVAKWRAAVQRGQRGWADTDAWNLGYHLARVTAEMLDHLAENSHGWPGNEEFPTPEDWETALRQHAANLHAYASDSDELRQALDEWYAMTDDPATSKADEKAAFEHHTLLEVERDARAVASMHWVAEHLGQLWD